MTEPTAAEGTGPCPVIDIDIVAFEEWHARIQNYRLAEGLDLIERGGQLSLQSLPLKWDI